jgi:thymidylate synthase ThyX
VDDSISILDHGFVRLDGVMADDLSVVNGARVSFARRKTEMDESDEALVRFLMRDRHGSPFEHNAFRFHVRCPIFVAREWFRHRVGCLTGDTVVTFVDTNGHASKSCAKTIDELWRMWTVGERDGHALSEEQYGYVDMLSAAGVSQREIARRVGVGRRAVRSRLAGAAGTRDARWRVRRMPLRVLDESTGQFTIGHVADVVNKGPQPVYGLTLADGKELTLTENHRLLTESGWKTMRQAVGLVGVGDEARMTSRCALMVNGLANYQDRGWLAARREEGKSVSAIAEEAGSRVHAEYDYVCQSCGRRGEKLHAHHIVPVWLDVTRAREIGNLISVCDECHPQIHRTRESELAFAERYAGKIGFASEGKAPSRTGFVLTAHAVEVISLAYVGVRQTYDLVVSGRWHNFVANGVVVHNSFNEFSLRYAKATDDFYIPEADDVRTQVGKPGAYSFEPVDDELAERTRETLQEVYGTAFAAYEELVAAGVARELARSVLPVGAYTQFYWTVNARSLMNFVSLRNSEFAQLEIRRYAEAVEGFFAEVMPVTYASFVEGGRVAP